MDTSLPLVTVGLPVYNRPEGLKVTLESMINQTYQNLEIIIADNCSPNLEVEKVANEYKKKDNRITYYRHSSNKGWGYNAKFAIDKAKGDYYMRVTDDDLWDITFVEKIMGLMLKDEKAVIGFCDFISIDANGNRFNSRIKNYLPLLQQFSEGDKLTNIKNYINQFEAYGKAVIYDSIFKIDLLRSQPVSKLLKEEFIVGDCLTVLYALLRGNLVIYPEVLLKVRTGNDYYYDKQNAISKKINLLFLVVDYGVISNTFKKWNSYFVKSLNFVSSSELRVYEKLAVCLRILRRVLLFYYDIICVGFKLKGYDIFSKIKRKHYLE